MDMARASAALQSADDLELRVLLRLEAEEAEGRIAASDGAAPDVGGEADGSWGGDGALEDARFHAPTATGLAVGGDVLARAREFAALPAELLGSEVDASGCTTAMFLPEERERDMAAYVSERGERDSWLLRARGFDGAHDSGRRGERAPETRPLTAQGAALHIAEHVAAVACRQAVREAAAEVVDGLARSVVDQG